jgi:hypothetical protein
MSELRRWHVQPIEASPSITVYFNFAALAVLEAVSRSVEASDQATSAFGMNLHRFPEDISTCL